MVNAILLPVWPCYLLGQGIHEKIYYPRFDIPQVMIWDFNWLK